MQSLRRTYTSLKLRGVKATICLIFSQLVDYFFDIRYGTDTISWWAHPEDLTIASNNKKRGKMYSYQATRSLSLAKLFRRIAIPNGSVLVDLGCGKGRVLLIASRFGFKEVRGVEYAHELCETARKNCSIYKAKTGVGTEFQIIESDVIDYTINSDENIFFMFNPFDAEVLSKVLDNIIRSLSMHTRSIWIIYRNPVFAKVIETHGSFTNLREFWVWGDYFKVYSNIR